MPEKARTNVDIFRKGYTRGYTDALKDLMVDLDNLQIRGFPSCEGLDMAKKFVGQKYDGINRTGKIIRPKKFIDEDLAK